MSDKIKTLSQAIRLGATFRPQCQGATFIDGKSCAIGAAYEAFTGIFNPEMTMNYAFGCLKLRFNLPDANLGCQIADMNDGWGWTREQIADWLEAQGL